MTGVCVGCLPRPSLATQIMSTAGQALPVVPWEDPHASLFERFFSTLRLSVFPTQLVARLGRNESWVRALTFGMALSLIFSPVHVAIDLFLKPEYRSGWLGILAANFLNDPIFIALDVLSWSLAAIVGATIAGVQISLPIVIRACAYTVWPWFAVRILLEGTPARWAELPLYVFFMVVLTALSSQHGVVRAGGQTVHRTRALLAGVPLPAVALAIKLARVGAA